MACFAASYGYRPPNDYQLYTNEEAEYLFGDQVERPKRYPPHHLNEVDHSSHYYTKHVSDVSEEPKKFYIPHHQHNEVDTSPHYYTKHVTDISEESKFYSPHQNNEVADHSSKFYTKPLTNPVSTTYTIYHYPYFHEADHTVQQAIQANRRRQPYQKRIPRSTTALIKV